MLGIWRVSVYTDSGIFARFRRLFLRFLLAARLYYMNGIINGVSSYLVFVPHARLGLILVL